MYEITSCNTMPVSVAVYIDGHLNRNIFERNEFSGKLKVVDKSNNAIIIDSQHLVLYINYTGKSLRTRLGSEGDGIRLSGKTGLAKNAILIDEIGTDDKSTDYVILPQGEYQLDDILSMFESFEY